MKWNFLCDHCLLWCLDKYLKNSYWGPAGKDYRYYRANLGAWTNRNIWFLYWRGIWKGGGVGSKRENVLHWKMASSRLRDVGASDMFCSISISGISVHQVCYKHLQRDSQPLYIHYHIFWELDSYLCCLSLCIVWVALSCSDHLVLVWSNCSRVGWVKNLKSGFVGSSWCFLGHLSLKSSCLTMYQWCASISCLCRTWTEKACWSQTIWAAGGNQMFLGQQWIGVG